MDLSVTGTYYPMANYSTLHDHTHCEAAVRANECFSLAVPL